MATEDNNSADTLEFKSHLYGIEIEHEAHRGTERGGLNRTFMELKWWSTTEDTGHHRFKSHLYGIEISYEGVSYGAKSV